LTEQGYKELDYQMVLIWDEIDKNEAIKQMEEDNKREAGIR